MDDLDDLELTKKEQRQEAKAEKRTQRIEKLLAPLKTGLQSTFGDVFKNLGLTKTWITILFILFISFLLVMMNYHSKKLEVM